jgi:hypothetical protein
MDDVDLVARDMLSLMKSQFGKKATESRIRDYFEDLMQDWADEADISDSECEEALDMAIEHYMDGYKG